MFAEEPTNEGSLLMPSKAIFEDASMSKASMLVIPEEVPRNNGNLL